MACPPPHVSYHRFRHFKQKLCRQERCLGSVNKSEHTEQDTSSRRLWNSIVRSMMSLGTKAKWPSMHSTNEVLWLSILSFSRKHNKARRANHDRGCKSPCRASFSLPFLKCKSVILKLKPGVKWSKPPRTHALGSDSLYYNKEHLKARKYTRDNWLKQILKTTVKSYKRIQTTGRPEDCPWEWRYGKICICTTLTISLLNSACLCYKLRLYPRSMLLKLNLQNLSLSDWLLKILWLSAISW